MGQQLSYQGSEDHCCNCFMKMDQQTVEWKSFLKQECLELLEECQWAGIIQNQLKQIQAFPIHKYYREFKDLDAVYRRDTKIGRKSQSYQNSFADQILQNDQYSQSKKNPNQVQEKMQRPGDNIVKMIKRTEIFEDDILNAMQRTDIRGSLKKNSNDINIKSLAALSFISGSSTPSYAYQEKRLLKQQLEGEPHQSSQIMKQISYFLQVTQIFLLHLQRSDHQLHFVFDLFISSLINSYGNTESEELVRLLFEIQQFSRVMVGCIGSYYDVNRQAGNNYMLLLTEENLLNFVVSLIMDQKTIYDIFYRMIASNEEEVIQSMKFTYKNLRGFTPQELGIPIKFQLNKDTYDYLKSKQKVHDCPPYTDSDAYTLAIKQMKKIREKYSASSKLKVIIKMSQMLMKGIQRFYKKYKFFFDGVVESDDLLPIQTYILLEAQIFDLVIHIYMIEKLATNKLLQGTSGYYLITIQVASQILYKLAMQQEKKDHALSN